VGEVPWRAGLDAAGLLKADDLGAHGAARVDEGLEERALLLMAGAVAAFSG
jgi:hypothetical protein